MGQLFKRLRPRTEARHNCLVLDTSYSMATDDGKGRRIDLLREAVQEIKPIPKIYYFGRGSGPVESASMIPEPAGSTPMERGFMEAKGGGFDGVILITDGYPDCEDRALQEAQGLRVDIIYVGPEPMPPFLDRLARACSGTLAIGHLDEKAKMIGMIGGLLEHKTDGAIQV